MRRILVMGFPQNGKTWIASHIGKKFSIIGRVSMDTITIDITKYKKIIKKGIYMELINKEYDIEKIAKDCGTISNEILTSISKRVKRKYI